MDVVNRYIFRQLFLAFLILIGVLTGLVWISQIIRLLNLVIERGRTIGQFLDLTGILVPSIAGMVAPGSLMIATVYVLNRFNTDNELVVMHAGGTSRWKILKPFALMTLLVTGFIIFVNLYALPAGRREFRNKLIEMRTDIIATLVQEGQFVTPERGLTVHIKAKGPGGEMLGLVFRDSRDPQRTVTYLAERARMIDTDDANILVMFQGTILSRRGSPQALDVVKFEQYSLDLKEFGGSKSATYYKPSGKYLDELFNPDPKDPVFLSDPNKLVAEAHDRLANPLYALAMMLIAFVGMSQARSTRTNPNVLILVVVGLGFGLRFSGFAVYNLIVSTGGFVPLAYLVPLTVIVAILAWLMWQSTLTARVSKPDAGATSRLLAATSAGRMASR